MHRNVLVGLLKKYKPSEQESMAHELMLTFVKENHDCFERSLESGHVTGSCWLVNNDNSHALLMLHTKLDRWLQLGGHCDGESDVLAVALKEAQEESGVMDIEPVSQEIFDIGVHLIPEHGSVKAHYHYDVRFLLRVVGDKDVVKNHESQALTWFGKNKELLPTEASSVVRMFDKWLAL